MCEVSSQNTDELLKNKEALSQCCALEAKLYWGFDLAFSGRLKKTLAYARETVDPLSLTYDTHDVVASLLAKCINSAY